MRQTDLMTVCLIFGIHRTDCDSVTSGGVQDVILDLEYGIFEIGAGLEEELGGGEVTVERGA